VALAQIRARFRASHEAVVDMPPVIGTGLNRVDARHFDGVDRLQHPFNLRPAGEAQQDLATRANEGDGGVGFTRSNGPQNVDARHHGAEIVRRPTDIGEDAVRREAEDAPPAVEDLFGDIAAEADPMLDPLLQPDQLDVREAVGCARSCAVPPSSGNSRASRARSM
jgi:hypothetical protein